MLTAASRAASLVGMVLKSLGLNMQNNNKNNDEVGSQFCASRARSYLKARNRFALACRQCRFPVSGAIALKMRGIQMFLTQARHVAGILTVLAFTALPGAVFGSSFVAFESDQTRPLVLSANGERLYATNTPDNRLEVFSVTQSGLAHLYSVPVGMEPVAIAERDETEVWVTNLLSDSVSIVRFFPDGPPRVVQTLLVGDEPRDIVLAGTERKQAFVATAHRGQNSRLPYRPFNSEGRANVWVFNVDEPLAEPQIITLFGDTPRALAVSPDGRLVYAAVYHSGNQTTALDSAVVAGNMPEPRANFEGIPGPWTGLIVKFDGTDWVDGAGQVWTDSVNANLPDVDVFAIDALTSRPSVVNTATNVGTTLFNMAVNPDTGAVYVSNTNARNEVRFEGSALNGSTSVRGHFVESRISILLGGVRVRHLNKHIDYESFPGTQAENDASLATPTSMAVTADGRNLYVAAFGSGKVGIFNTRSLALDTFTPDPDNHIQLSGGGPSGLALDEPRGRLYVLTRFNNAIAVVDLDSAAEVGSVSMYNPEPESITAGRRFFYDARYTSSRGDSSCAGCHIFGDLDHLAWDLGNPDGAVEPNPNPPKFAQQSIVNFHPLKGPMTTQSMRGLANGGPMHWRGDRTGGNDPDSGDALDDVAAFKAFNGAFESLLGRTAPLTGEEMQAFTDFALQLRYPPNPVRALDNSLDAAQEAGASIFLRRPGGGNVRCIQCHVIDEQQGFFGTEGLSGLAQGGTNGEQAMKIPHFRNLYTKAGFFNEGGAPGPGTGAPEIRGFGYVNSGAKGSLPSFLYGFQQFAGPAGDIERAQVASFLLAAPSGLAPIVGSTLR